MQYTYCTISHKVKAIRQGRGNQTIEFGQLIEYNIRIIFLEKLNAKCPWETIPRPFSKKPKLRISLGQ